MSSSPCAESNAQLSWQIPLEEPSKVRARLLQFTFAGLLCLGVVLLFGSRSFRIAALVGAIPFALFVLWRSRSRRHEPNDAHSVCLDQEGLHWCDSQGARCSINRDQIEGFRIGLDPDTLRALPALTLLLAGGFESQPVELHAPAGPRQVRQFLVEQIQVEEACHDERFAAALHGALQSACENESHRPELRLLRFGLLDPQRLSSGNWLVARLVDGQRVEYLPESCSFRCCHGESVEVVDNVAQLADFIRSEVLDGRDNDSTEWLSNLDQQQAQRDQLAVRREASELGVYIEIDPYGQLHIEGSRRGILELCQRIEDAAGLLRPAPLGARPQSISAGGTAIRLDVMLDDVPWYDPSTIAGPRAFLETVSKQIRQTVEGQSVADLLVEVEHSEFEAQQFAIHLRGDDYDPLSGFATKPDSRQLA